MHILVTGGNGQVGAECRRLAWPEATTLTVTDRSSLDITDAAKVLDVISSVRPDVVVNCAAYTAVDLAEDEPDLAYAVNVQGVENLAREADAVGAGLVHLSTDYVFDGEKNGWYVETDPPGPTGVYGSSKLAGEQVALAAKRSIVLRTSWVYGALGSNFVSTMRRLAFARDELGVVADQFGCPTAAVDIAGAIHRVIRNDLTPGGLYHCAAPDDATWFDLAEAAIGHTARAGSVRLKPIGTLDYPTKARRPVNSKLDSSALKRDHRIELRPWRKALAEVSFELNTTGRLS